jgi:hypothetical protein
MGKHFSVNPKMIYRRLWAKGIAAYKVWKDLENREEGYQMA